MNPIEEIYGEKMCLVLKRGVFTDIYTLIKHHKLPYYFIYTFCRVANDFL